MKTFRRVVLALALIVFIGALFLVTGILPAGSLPSFLPATLAWSSAITLVIFAVWEGYSVVKSWQLPDPEDPPRSERVIYPEERDEEPVVHHTKGNIPVEVERLEKATKALEEAEDFSKKSKDRVKIRIDTEDSR